LVELLLPAFLIDGFEVREQDEAFAKAAAEIMIASSSI